MHNHSTTMDDTHDSLVSNLERALWGNDTNVVPPSLSASSQQPPQTSSTTAATTATVTRVEPPSNNVISYCVHALVGALIGLVLVSFTSLALIEITFSPVFSVLLGLLFDALAVCLFYRSFSVPRGQTNLLTRLYVSLFATLVLVAGCTCIFLDGYLPEYQPFWKTTIYSGLSTASLFILTFAVVDWSYVGLLEPVSRVLAHLQRRIGDILTTGHSSSDYTHRYQLIHQQATQQQVTTTTSKTTNERNTVMAYPMIVFLLGVISAAVGGVHGLLFGPLELIGNNVGEDRSEMNASQYLILPVGVVAGSLFALVCRYIRLRIDQFLSANIARVTVADRLSEDLEGRLLLSQQFANRVASKLI